MATKFPDKQIPSRESYTVYEDYSANLNQTNIDGNNNKFYIIQLLISDNKPHIWTRWGRVGEIGKFNMEDYDSLDFAVVEFGKKFKSKTGNKWGDAFVSKNDKYTLIAIEEKDSAGDNDSPMGKLSKEQIEKGQHVLVNLRPLLENSKENKISVTSISSQFYSLIPTVTGRKRPPPIDTIDILEEKEEMLKFYLRMGFEEVDKEDTGLTPISGIMKLTLMNTLKDAIGKCCDVGSINSSVSKGDLLLKKNAGNPVKVMNKELYGSIMLYTSNVIYADLNKVLRAENRAGVKKYFNYLRMLFEAMNCLPKKEVTLWRGISVDLYDQYKVGSTITWWGVSSCTSEKSVAEGFMKGCGNNCTFLTIDTKTATDISDITFYSSEKESLLAPGTQLKVISSERKGKVTHIHLEEVGCVVE
ncbi:putative transmembrane protein [Bodo saltans virus]|uniref:Transmembrane protein n=1 Tax=Bodo saltans virus TaxID=2024608 RepID=A0A2H4UW42_9VIRU|nr:putative transmembrane protein [Bodo saltans virus]ATZ81114.1 putative transmembrane protein [Bodo saltans virus]